MRAIQLLPSVIYLLCLATSGGCAVLLVRSYYRNKTRLLLWTALCFVGLAFNNLALFLDLVIFPSVDLISVRTACSLAAIGILLYAFVWEAE